MSEEEMKSLKSRVDKLTCGMTEEETNKLYRKIIEYINEPIIEYINCEINVNDPFDNSRAFRKIPTYNDLFNENKKLNNIINELEHDFESYDLDYLQETYQGSLANFIEIELKRIKELKRR